MGKELLLEIGTEEIPAAFLPKAITDMEDMIRKILSEKRIGHGAVRAMATPRRLCLYLAEVAEKQEDQLVEKMGPAKRVAFDENGNPSKALAGFARGQGMNIADLISVTTEKGEYLCARKMIAGEETKALLPEILAKFIPSIPFKKSMRWSDLELRFARPIHWVVALFGGEIVPFRIENIASGRETRGHRFMSPEPVAVKDYKDYLVKTREKFVIVDPDERRKVILEAADKAAAGVGGKVLRNDELLEVVTFLIEYPTAVCGSYDASYLELPAEVLITSMMSHQKYFPVVDDKGKLMPYFITINNTLARDPSVVARGNEKVIRARLSDARFFFQEDRKISLDKRVEDLQKVVFHSQLGTSFEKVQRFRKLAAYIAKQVNPALLATADRAATLAKADLDTQMVGEFSELQGVMGREYALIAGENPVVAKAIYEHYLPIAAGGELPATDEGAIVSIADKIDTIVGFFGVNLIPTGTADPYALRRQALGIVNIILDKKYPLLLDGLVDESLRILGDLLKKPAAQVKAEVLEFFKARFENQLISQGHPYDVVDSVLATGISDITRTFKKIEAMESFKNHVDYAPLAVAFKRAGNIIKDFHGGSINPAIFETDEERVLFEAFEALKRKAATLIDNDDYQGALMEMALLRKPVDAFFESVLVMAKDDKIRYNRLSLLEEIFVFFRRIADFSKIVTESKA
jgi:glycyl-tRNA synthetase beta chain